MFFNKKEKTNKRASKWLSLVSGIVAAATVGTLVLGLMTGCSGGSGKNYTLYLKDDELFFTDFSDDKALQVTGRLFNEDSLSNSDIADSASSVAARCTLSLDGKILFFPDKVDSFYGGISLYYRHVNKAKEEAVKISSDITSYDVNEKATLVTYKKGDGNGLYQYDMKADSAEKISEDVSNYWVSKDGKTVVYTTIENGGAAKGNLYTYTTGQDKNKIDSEIERVARVSEDCKTVYYIKDDSLYMKEAKEDNKEKIASDVDDVITVFESGEIYFTKSETNEIKLSVLVEDDMKDADAAITAPGVNSWWPRDEEADTTDKEDAWEKYYAKLVRDQLREQMDTYTIDREESQLFYYNGKEVVSVIDNYDTWHDYAEDSAVLIFSVFSSKRVKLSEVAASYDSFSDLVDMVVDSGTTPYIAVGKDTTQIESKDATRFDIDGAGSAIFYLDELNDEGTHGELYQIEIKKGKVGDAKLYDSDVYVSYRTFVADGQYRYFKDVDAVNNKGELYLNKKRVDFDVRLSNVIYSKETKRLFYFTDWNSDKSYGTLKVFAKDKAAKISDDVNRFLLSAQGDALFMKDYSFTNYKGDLYIYQKNKAEKLDVDVVAVLSTHYAH